MKRIVMLVLMMLIGGYGAVRAETPGPLEKSSEVLKPAENKDQQGEKQQEDKKSTENSNQGNRQTPTETETSTKEFLGFKWGLGIGVMGGFGGDTPVEKASLVGSDKIVQVDEEGDFRPQMFLEMHAFTFGKKAKWWRDYQRKMAAWRETGRTPQNPTGDKAASSNGNPPQRTAGDKADSSSGNQNTGNEPPPMPDPPLMGFGPFVALQGSENKVINALTVGFMIGRRKSPTDALSVDIGVGLSFDPSVQVLGHGIKEGQKLPAGEDAVRFKKEGRFGWAVLTSFTF